MKSRWQEDSCMATLIMLSGGLDSTYSLVKYLRETDEELVVHHVNLLDTKGRHKLERIACISIVEFCRKKYRDFFFSETMIDHRRLIAQGYDILALGLEAGAICASYHLATERSIDEWVVGRCTEEVLPPSRQKLAQQICEMNCQKIIAPPTWATRFPRVSQQEQVNYLPSELYEMTWSCRNPVLTDDEYLKCGECHACIRLQALRAEPVQS